ncbi:MAG TPA: guanitoxin biosynthesis heme-dependent pre-guanitoxin N-hydroxylase GntA [Dyella sp.]|nr:guanitoxin biosynthesis heme-dependent pre-guanitoxin N-hydroxylase GntA [Dyella sp.]
MQAWLQPETSHETRALGGHPAYPPDSIEAAFEAFIDAASFPCLGAKASRSRGQQLLVRGDSFVCATDDLAIARHLQALAEPLEGPSFISVAVLFPNSPALDEATFERTLWERLASIHAIDRGRYGWDTRVSDDPASPSFSMSVGGKAFYVVGLHPGSSRPARRFRCPVLVFNLHSQFEQLRADGRYDKLREAILQRDLAYAGSPNPMLAVHGRSSEARQYSGREVDTDWVCPFSPRDQGA